MNKSSLIVSVVIALLGIFVGLYYAKNANDELEAYRAEHNGLMADAAEEVQVGEKVMADGLSASNTSRVHDTDSLDWLTALMENTSASYHHYLDQHADGAHASEAREILLVIASRKVQQTVAAEVKKDSVELQEEPDTIS